MKIFGWNITRDAQKPKSAAAQRLAELRKQTPSLGELCETCTTPEASKALRKGIKKLRKSL